MKTPALVLSVTLAMGVLQAGGSEKPLASASQTQAKVRLLQAAVSVRNPKQQSSAPLAGLTAWHFDVRLDGRRLQPGDDVSIDPVCLDQEPDPNGASLQRPVLIFADFNYLDAAGRVAVAGAIEQLADRLDQSPQQTPAELTYKVFAIARGAHELTRGFTRDPAELRQVAEAISGIHYRNGGDAGPVTGPGKLLTEILDPLSSKENRGEDPEFRNLASRGGFSIRPETDSNNSTLPFESIVEPPRDSYREDELCLGDRQCEEKKKRIPRITKKERNANRQGLTGNTKELFSAMTGMRQQEAELDALAGYDAAASVEAIRTVLLAHAALPGRKAVVLYSSNAFDIARQQRLQAAIDSLRPLFNGLYVFWTADTAGLAPQSATRSPLLSMLAADSGGGSLRRSSELGRAIESAERSVACYYLISVRLPADEPFGREHQLRVEIDTRRFPELWGARVVQAAGLERLRGGGPRLEPLSAALLAPDGFHAMDLQAALDGPYWSDGEPFAVVQARLPLDQLEPDAAGNPIALDLEMLVTADAAEYGAPVCRFATPPERPILISPRLSPLRREHGEVVMDMPCFLPRSGSYTATVVLTDRSSGRVAAARDRAAIRLSALSLEPVSIARLATHSPADLVWNPTRRWATPHASWPVWRLRDGDRQIAQEEEVVIRYLSCPDREQKGWLLRWAEGDEPELLPVDQVHHAAVTVDNDLLAIPGCTTRAVAFPPFSLATGSYRFVLADPEASAEQILAQATSRPANGAPTSISFEMREQPR